MIDQTACHERARRSSGPFRSALADLLAPWLPTQRWFAGKGHTLTQVVVTDAVSLPAVA